MIAIRATYRDGRLEPSEPLQFRDGTELELEVREKDEPPSQTEIESVLAAMDRMQPLLMDDAELDAWSEDRKARKEWEKGRLAERSVKLEDVWQ